MSSEMTRRIGTAVIGGILLVVVACSGQSTSDSSARQRDTFAPAEESAAGVAWS